VPLSEADVEAMQAGIEGQHVRTVADCHGRGGRPCAQVEDDQPGVALAGDEDAALLRSVEVDPVGSLAAVQRVAAENGVAGRIHDDETVVAPGGDVDPVRRGSYWLLPMDPPIGTLRRLLLVPTSSTVSKESCSFDT